MCVLWFIVVYFIVSESCYQRKYEISIHQTIAKHCRKSEVPSEIYDKYICYYQAMRRYEFEFYFVTNLNQPTKLASN